MNVITARPIGQVVTDQVYDVLGCKGCGATNHVPHRGEGGSMISAFPCDSCGAWSIIPAPRRSRRELGD